MSGDLRRRMDRLEVASGVEDQDWQYQFLRSINGNADAKAKIAEAGVARVYTPKDYDLNAIMADLVEVVNRSCREAA
jgi:hypothetical protein